MSNIPFNTVILFTLFSINVSLASLITNLVFTHEYYKLLPQAFGPLTQGILIYYFARGSDTARKILGWLSSLGIVFLTLLAFSALPAQFFLEVIGLIYLLLCAFQIYCLFFSKSLRKKLEYQRAMLEQSYIKKEEQSSHGGESDGANANSRFRKSIVSVILYSVAFMAFSLMQLYFYGTNPAELIGSSLSVITAVIVACLFGYIVNRRSFNKAWVPISLVSSIIGLSCSLSLGMQESNNNIILMSNEFTKTVANQSSDWRFQKINSSLEEIDSEKCRGQDSLNSIDDYSNCQKLFNNHVFLLRELLILSDQFYDDQTKDTNLLIDKLMDKYSIQHKYAVEFRKRFSNQVNTNREKTRRLINSYLSLDLEYESLYKFLGEHKNNLETKESVIVFKDEENREWFNEHISKIQDLAKILAKTSEMFNIVRK